jgi:hypothetical protein
MKKYAKERDISRCTGGVTAIGDVQIDFCGEYVKKLHPRSKKHLKIIYGSDKR